MINFFILNGDQKRTCTASDVSKATQILSLMFPASRGYVVEDNKVVFAHNMTLDEAEITAGLKLQSMTVLAPKAALVKPKKVVKKPVVKAKKTKLKSKVVVKNNKKAVAKKTVVKSKVKPKTKAKKPVKAKAKGKKR